MSDVQLAEMPTISVTPSAAKRIAEILRDDGSPNMMLRIAVSGGGCSGFQYGFTLDDTRNDDDVAVQRDGVTVLVDSMSVEFMKGAEVDFVEDMIGASFQIKNPNATSKCGCGSSFAV
jgi:iron-sulfur cluster insertion protein